MSVMGLIGLLLLISFAFVVAGKRLLKSVYLCPNDNYVENQRDQKLLPCLFPKQRLGLP